MKIEGDLQIHKIRRECESEMNNLSGEIDHNSALVDELKNYLGIKKLDLKFIKEDLQNKEGS